MAISDWPESERPRERLLARGATALSDAELVAVLLRTGIRGKSAVDLAREMIEEFGSLGGLLAAGSALNRIKGLGAAKSALFIATLELARRSIDERLQQGSALTSPGAVRDYLRLTLATRPHEDFVCLWLDAQHRVIGIEEPFRGTLTQTIVYP
jgi:DNA repair protein RadC